MPKSFLTIPTTGRYEEEFSRYCNKSSKFHSKLMVDPDRYSNAKYVRKIFDFVPKLSSALHAILSNIVYKIPCAAIAIHIFPRIYQREIWRNSVYLLAITEAVILLLKQGIWLFDWTIAEYTFFPRYREITFGDIKANKTFNFTWNNAVPVKMGIHCCLWKHH